MEWGEAEGTQLPPYPNATVGRSPIDVPLAWPRLKKSNKKGPAKFIANPLLVTNAEERT